MLIEYRDELIFENEINFYNNNNNNNKNKNVEYRNEVIIENELHDLYDINNLIHLFNNMKIL